MNRKVKQEVGLITDRQDDGSVTVAVFDKLGCNHQKPVGSSADFFEVTARDPVGVAKGDKVEVEIEPRSFGKIASIVFGIPAVTLVGGLGLGSLISRLFWSGNHFIAFQGATAGTLFLISLVGLVIYDRSLANRTSERAEVVKLLEKEPDEDSLFESKSCG